MVALGLIGYATDGFVISRKDLELRGPGEVLGVRQTGEMQFHIADIVRDQPVLPLVQRAADTIMNEYPQSVAPLVRRWLGEKTDYVHV